MATTAENVSMIQSRVPNYSRPQILSEMSELHIEVYSQETEQTLYIDPATGMPPRLATTAGVYDYDAPSNARRTDSIFSVSFPQTFNRARPVGPRKEYYFRNMGYHSLAVSSYDRLPDGTLARVVFENDPGTTTEQYYHAYWVYVAPLDTEADQLLIPSWTHRDFRLGIVAMLRQEDYGNTDREEKIIQRLLRRIRNQLNRGAQRQAGQTPVSEEQQIYPETGYYRF